VRQWLIAPRCLWSAATQPSDVRSHSSHSARSAYIDKHSSHQPKSAESIPRRSVTCPRLHISPVKYGPLPASLAACFVAGRLSQSCWPCATANKTRSMGRAEYLKSYLARRVCGSALRGFVSGPDSVSLIASHSAMALRHLALIGVPSRCARAIWALQTLARPRWLFCSFVSSIFNSPL
jgi:hypothetical protein